MTPSDFVEKLIKAVPSKSELLEAGFNEIEAEEELARYTCRSREQPLNYDTLGDNLLELILHWDLSSLEIGPLTFELKPKYRSKNLLVGKVELDELVYDFGSKGYLLLDHEIEDRTLCKAAPNGLVLMSTLLVISDFYGGNTIDFEILTNEIALAEVKQQCVGMLGPEYSSFCSILLGV